MMPLTCSERQRIVLFEQLSLLVQEPLGAEYLRITPEAGVSMEAPQVHQHHCVLHQVTPN